jgi:CRP/FNR family transcriptional regulator
MPDHVDIRVLGQLPLFAGLTNSDLKSIGRVLTSRHYSPGAVVVAESQAGIGFYLIVKGLARVEIGDQAVKILGAGATFGETALLTSRNTRTASVIAETELETYAMVSWDFSALIKHHPEISARLAASLAQQIQEQTSPVQPRTVS